MQKGFPLILITLVVVLGVFFLYQQQTKSTQTTPLQTTAQPTVAADETANWKTYAGKSFSIKYTKEYSYQESTTVSSPEYPSEYPIVKFVKTNGNFYIAVANNVKGLTLDNTLGNGPYLRYTKDALAGKIVKKIKIDNVNAVLVEDLNVGQSGVSFDIIVIKDSNIYQLVSEGVTYQDFIQILSTFKFTDSQTSQMFSTEGQNCGRNAGAGGDAQCASGLICQYKNAQEEKNGIGTCVKK